MRYEKGRREETRRRITEVAAQRFRSDGIAASGLAGIMGEAGLTNGAFYPHFESKSELVRESVAAALNGRSETLREVARAGGLEAAIAAYLSPEHRDNPGTGCALAALLPELARQPAEIRDVCAKNFAQSVRDIAAALPAELPNPEAVATGLYATLIGTIQLARAAQDTPQSDRILKAGIEAALALIGARRQREAKAKTRAPAPKRRKRARKPTPH